MGWTGCFLERVRLQRLGSGMNGTSSMDTTTPALASIGIDIGKDVFHLVVCANSLEGRPNVLGNQGLDFKDENGQTTKIVSQGSPLLRG
jgi:hypothetical protein